MADYVWGDKSTQFFSDLSPDLILDSVEALGLKTTGRCLTLNSMENRVYEIEVDDYEHQFVIGKFYRPGRWTKNQIEDEHKFLLELAEEEIPVVAPIIFNGTTIFETPEHGLWYSLFPKRSGRIPDELSEKQLEVLGRLIARIHNVGARIPAEHRLKITPSSFGLQNLEFLLDSKLILPQFTDRFSSLVKDICDASNPLFEKTSILRIHGDCHMGNVISRDEEIFCIDFDDMLMGPAVQDIWLLIPGDDQQAVADRNIFLDQYETFRDFDHASLKLIEPLRALRYIHFAAWIGKRWEDGAFKRAFPYYGTDQYWSTLTYDLHFQLEKINNSLRQPQYY